MGLDEFTVDRETMNAKTAMIRIRVFTIVFPGTNHPPPAKITLLRVGHSTIRQRPT